MSFSSKKPLSLKETNIYSVKNHNTDILCFTCVHKIAQYTSGHFDCNIYGRVKNMKACDTYINNQIAS
jgi:hypothetical protein